MIPLKFYVIDEVTFSFEGVLVVSFFIVMLAQYTVKIKGAHNQNTIFLINSI